MTTRAHGLTAAMRRALTDRTGCPFSNGGRMKRALQLRGLIDANSNRREARIQAALAAPRMSAAELAMLERIERAAVRIDYLTTQDYRAYRRLEKSGYAERWRQDLSLAHLPPAGLTALNNMRAAMGSAEYRE